MLLVKRWREEGKRGVRWGGGGMVNASALWVIRPPSAAGKLVRSAAAATWGGVRRWGWVGLHRMLGGTHWQPIVLHHFIKLLVNFFVFLFSAGGEREGLLGVWALRVTVLFLVQSLRFPERKEKGKAQRQRRGQTEREKKKNRESRLAKVTKVWWYSRYSVWRGCPGPRSCGHLADFGRWSRRHRAQGCCNH